MGVIQVEIVSDVICPWCYIGYRTLQKTIALYQKTYPGGSRDEFHILWKPYFLDQVAPTESTLIQDRMLRRMDTKQVDAAQTRLKRVGAGAGIHFKFGGYMGSSRLAHRLLFLAEKEGSEVQCKVSENLFYLQFEAERDISDLETVIEAGRKAGLSEEKVREYLAGDEGISEMETEAKEIRAAGVQSVPHFIIDGDQRLDGAADFSEFFEAFVAAREGADTAR